MDASKRLFALLFVATAVVCQATGGRGDDQKTSQGDLKRLETFDVSGTVVDEQGKPVPGATVEAVLARDRTHTTSDADGKFVFKLDKSRKYGLTVTASTGADQRLGHFQQYDVSKVPAEITLTLRPAREISAQVTDGDGKPVAGALLRVTQSYGVIAAATADDAGHVRVLVPQDADLQYVYAYKPDVGVDYFLYRPREPNERTPDNPFALAADHSQPLTFVLNGTRSVTIHVTDDQEKPLADIPVYTWYLQKPKKGGDLNIGGTGDFEGRTDGQGRVVFRIVPADNVGRVTFWVRHEDYFNPERPMFDPNAGGDELHVKMLPLVPVTGIVSYADGKPAADAEIAVAGDGYTFDGFRGTTRSGADGTFKIRVNPNQFYMFVATLKKQVSAPESRVVLPGEPIEEVRLTLQNATRVFGTVTVGQNNKPVAGEYIQLYLEPSPDYYQLPKSEQLPQPPKNNKAISPRIVLNVTTDIDGKFEFWAGPGKYYMIRIQGQNGEAPKFVLADDEEFEVNLHSDLPATIDFRGQVVRQLAKKRGVGETRVEFAGSDFSASPFEATSDKEGRLQVKRTTCEMLLYSQSEDRLLAGIAHLDPEDNAAEILLAPTASVRGRLVDAQTGRPLPGIEIDYGIRIKHPGGSFSQRFGGSGQTDAAGEFVAVRLVPGWEYEIRTINERDAEGSPRRWGNVGTFKPERAEFSDAGDFQVKGPEREPLDAFISRNIKGKFPHVKRLERALAAAQLGQQRLLILVARSEAPPLKQFFDLYLNLAEEAALRDDLVDVLRSYQVLPVDSRLLADDPLARAWAERLKITRPPVDEMQAIVLDNDGSLVTQTPASALVTRERLDIRRLTGFMTENGPPIEDSLKKFSAAVEKAQRDDKQVLLLQTDPHSAGSLLMTRWLNANRELLSRDFVLARVDARDEHAEKLVVQVRGEMGTAPWLAICDARGKPLATSDGPEGNIGYPATAADCRALAAMFNKTIRRLTAEDIQRMIEALP
jgi:protocatechuate 3,4-dioxygenase beta subunit